MKNMKKILALVIAALMIAGMMSAFAATTSRDFTNLSKDSTSSSLTIKNTGKTAHSFELYQIFKGDIDNTGVLANIEWGSGVTSTYAAGNDAKTKAESLKNADDAKAFAAALQTEGLAATPSDKKDNIAAGANAEFTGLNPGYYMVIDKAGSQDNVEEGAYTAYIMEVVGVVAATTKLDIPSIDKAVSDNDSKDKTTNGSSDTIEINGTTYTFAETADHAINEHFMFDLKATIPGNANMAEYKEYGVEFHDTFSKGVTFVEIKSVTVTNNGNTFTVTEGNEDYNYSKSVTASTASAGGSFDLEIKDIMKLVDGEKKIDLTKETVIKVVYEAYLNKNAIVTNASGDYVVNDNKVYLEYSNEPNGDGKGKTKPDDVWVFTYELDNVKVASDELTEVTDSSVITELEKISFPASGYAKYDGRVYCKKVENSVTKYYIVAMPSGDIAFSLTKSGESTPIKFSYDSEGKFYYPDASGSADLVPKADNFGIFNIHGLDEGVYTLSETTVPFGYNKAADVTVTIKVDETTGHYEITTGDKAHVTLDNINDDNIIINEKGTSLPSTGGIGTTLFYVGGGILVLAAVILLVTKRRMGSED